MGYGKRYCGCCLETMPTLEPDLVDSIVTDPPYGLSFMGKGWDHGIPGVPFWVEALRVAKPGAFLLAFGGTRTHHRLMVAIEDAGWEIRDCIMWVYGSGFPKSLDVSKAIDKAAGEEREVIGIVKGKGGQNLNQLSRNGSDSDDAKGCGAYGQGAKQITVDIPLTIPATDAARQWEGWGTALKPAWEPIIVARKPIVGTVAANVLKYGTGGMNIDGCRVGTESVTTSVGSGFGGTSLYSGGQKERIESTHQGRWPANLIHDGSDEVVGLFPFAKSGVSNGNAVVGEIPSDGIPLRRGTLVSRNDSGSTARFFKQIPIDYSSLSCYLCDKDTSKEDVCKNINADIVEKSSMITRATNQNTVHKNAEGMQEEQLVHYVRCVESLCDSCATSFVQNLVAISGFRKDSHNKQELQVIQDFTGNYKNYILLQSLASFAERMENIGTTPITINLLKLFGSANLVITSYIQETKKSEPKRFIYAPKASRNDRGEGNTHPTVKSVKLMEYLIKLVTQPGGTVLDPFAGSFSTAIAAINLNMKYICIEKDPDYYKIGSDRIRNHLIKTGKLLDLRGK